MPSAPIRQAPAGLRLTPLAGVAHPRVCGESVRSPWCLSKVLRAIPATAGSPSYLAGHPSMQFTHDQAKVTIKPSSLRCSLHPPLLIQQ